MTDNPALIKWQMPQPFIIEKRSAPNRDRYLEMLRASLPDDEISLDDFDPVFFRVIASDQSLDSYYTRMSENTIENFAEDANRGVSLQQSHNGHQSLGLGRSLEGNVSGKKGNKQAEMLFYTVPGLVSGGVSSENLITGIRSGVYRDVSVGFSPDYFECSICGLDPFDWRAKWDDEEACWHWPGLDYKNEKGKTETAFAWIHNARLNEVSFVYDGANENAGIIAIEKARFAKQRGLLPGEIETLLEKRYKIDIPGPPVVGRGVELVGTKQGRATGEESGQPAENEVTQNDELEFLVENTTEEVEGERTPEAGATAESAVEEGSVVEYNESEAESAPSDPADTERWKSVRGKHEGQGKVFKSLGDDPIRAADLLASEVTRLREELNKNRRHVAFGDAYEQALIRDCHTEGVRAMGEAYNRTHWDAIYRRMDATELEATKANYESLASARFPGGRITSDVASSKDIKPEDNAGLEYTV